MERMLTLSQKGYDCAQILLMLALESEGKEDPDLIRAMGGLTGGLGNTGGICGCLTGGACLLSYYTGKGEDDEIPHSDHDLIIANLRDWFAGYTAEYGSCDCRAILGGDRRNRIQRCPLLLEATLETCLSLLEEHGCL